jgi:hypothetical protein
VPCVDNVSPVASLCLLYFISLMWSLHPRLAVRPALSRAVCLPAIVRRCSLLGSKLLCTNSAWLVSVCGAVPCLKRLIAGLSPRRLGFAPGSIHVGFVVDKVALRQVFLRVLRFSPVNISFHRRSPSSYHLGNA